jgi:hypothetical protein
MQYNETLHFDLQGFCNYSLSQFICTRYSGALHLWLLFVIIVIKIMVRCTRSKAQSDELKIGVAKSL